MKFLMVYPNSTGNTKVPLGVLYLMTLLEKEGHKVRLFDMTFYGVDFAKNDIQIRGKYLNFEPIDMKPYGVRYSMSTMDEVLQDYSKVVNDFQPDVVGISITEDTSLVGLDFAIKTKEVKPSTLVMVGGVYCMTRPEQVIASEAVDIVCIGEGEVTVVELFHRLERNSSYNDVKGIWVKDKSGHVIKNPVAPPTDLDSVPFADLSKISDLHLYNPMAGHVYKMTFVESQRGCPRRCTYCCNQLFLDAYKDYKSQYLRKKSIPRLIDELAYYKKSFNINFFQFTDDDFLLRNIRELTQFKELYQKHIDLPFWIQAEAWNATEEKIKLVREAGCIAISMGIETGSEKIRVGVYQRNTPTELTLKAFETMHRYGIRTSANVIIGVPEEGRDEIFETVNIVKACNPCSLNVNIFTPYYGTVLRDVCVNLGYLSEDYHREGRASWQAVLEMPQISRLEIEALARTFTLYSTLPESYYPEIKKCEMMTGNHEEIFAELEELCLSILRKRGLNYDVPGFDYSAFLKSRQEELLL